MLNIFHYNHCAPSNPRDLCSTYLLNDKNFNTCFITICFYKLSCLSHIFYADFKLQKNKVQSRKLSFAVIGNFDTEFIVSLLNEEKTIEEVSLILQDMYTNKREPQTRSLKCYCVKHGISKRILQNTLYNLVVEAFEEVGFRTKHNNLCYV